MVEPSSKTKEDSGARSAAHPHSIQLKPNAPKPLSKRRYNGFKKCKLFMVMAESLNPSQGLSPSKH
jgi:hypothetical protein